MRKKLVHVRALVSTWILLVLLALPAGAQNGPAREPLTKANETQKEVLAELAGILNEEKVRLSDGAIQNALQALLNDETEQLEAIRDLGRRTIGKSPQELTEAENAERAELADNQQVYADRYRRLEKSIEAKAAAQPDSLFTKVLLIASDTALLEKMEDAVAQLEANQLGNALRSVTAIVEALGEMVETIAQDPGEDVDKMDGKPGDSFAVPSLWVKGKDQTLSEFKWPGDKPDAMGRLLKALRRLDDLAKRQKIVATQTAERAPTETKAAELAAEEWEIRFLALETGGDLALLDPKIQAILRTASRSIEEAIPGMEQGPLGSSVEPAARAAAELEEAAEYLRSVWKEILDFIKGYTQELEPLVGGAMSLPHGMSKKQKDELERMVFSQMRATLSLVTAIERQTALGETTAGALEGLPVAEVRQEQQSIREFVETEVLPYNINLGELPEDLQKKQRVNEMDAPQLLSDAFERMDKAAEALEAGKRETLQRRQDEAAMFMGDALAVMTDVLARLLGQFSPPGLAPFSGAAMGMALDPSGGGIAEAGWDFELTDDMRETIRQAFRGEFPERYESAIKAYYESIASQGRGE